MPEDQDVEASVYPKVTEDQDAESSYHPEFPEDQDSEASAYPEVPEYQDAEASAHHKLTVSGVRDDVNTHNTPDYFRTMDIYVKDIYKMIRIYGVPSTRQFMHLILERLNYFLKRFLKRIRISHKAFHIISIIIFKISPYKKFICTDCYDIPGNNCSKGKRGGGGL